MRLNIIGNGFDLYHGLPCSYYHFACFLAEHYPDFYKEMSDMFNFSYCRRYGYDDIEIVADEVFWRTFEERLGELDSIWMEHSLLDDLGLECSDPIDIDIPEINNSDKIKRIFCEWVATTLNTEDNYKIIRKAIGRKKQQFNQKDYFINFNYTQTLEKIYNISDFKVYHIHGKCCFDKDDSSLIVGHGNNRQISFLKEKIKEIKNEGYYLSEQSVRNRLNEYECELAILKDLRKNVEMILDSLKIHLNYENLDIEEICVWGLSCGSVDKPYIEFLKERYPNAKWKFSYYNMKEKKERTEFTTNLQFDETKVEYFEFNNSYCEEICRQIIDTVGIQELPTIKGSV